MAQEQTTRCNRCGSFHVAWVKSRKTGRYYLAFATRTTTRSQGATYAHIVHKCDEPTAGGYKACEHCGRHHFTTYASTAADCARFPEAR